LARFRPFAWTLVAAAALFAFVMPAAAQGRRTGLIESPQTEAGSSGRATFQQFCAPCHGPSGKGNGAVAAYLLKAPADVTQLRRRANGVFPRAELEAALLATSRDETSGKLGNEEILWGPLFLSFGPESARALVADLLAFLESVQEQ
jgi:mono/diheme cytochrome c family protein